MKAEIESFAKQLIETSRSNMRRGPWTGGPNQYSKRLEAEVNTYTLPRAVEEASYFSLLVEAIIERQLLEGVIR